MTITLRELFNMNVDDPFNLNNIMIDFKTREDNEEKHEQEKEERVVNEENIYEDDFDLPKGDEVRDLNSITSGYKNKNNNENNSVQDDENKVNDQKEEREKKNENDNLGGFDDFDLDDII